MAAALLVGGVSGLHFVSQGRLPISRHAAGNLLLQARSHNGLACAHQLVGDLDQARRHWQSALAQYKELGVPEAMPVQARLNSARTQPGE